VTTMALDDQQARARVQRVGTLLEQVESLPDLAARSMALELVQTCLELYGEGLARVVRHAGGAGGDALAQALAADELVSHLLLLHGLHPLDARTRIARALQALEPRLRAHGASVELLGVEGGTARLRLHVGGGCGSSGATARAAVEDAVAEAAPDVERVEIEEPGPGPALIPAESLFRTSAHTGRGVPGAGVVP
jgi:Fe-S cluster biogenesis protein NfuA